MTEIGVGRIFIIGYGTGRLNLGPLQPGAVKYRMKGLATGYPIEGLGIINSAGPKKVAALTIPSEHLPELGDLVAYRIDYLDVSRLSEWFDSDETVPLEGA